MPRPPPAIIAALTIALTGCRAREASFHARTFSCDPALVGSCGTTREGRPMTCFAGRQLGARDICVDGCTTERDERGGPASVCLSSGASLASCRPSARPGETGACTGDGLSCYRTNMVADEGVCMAISPCNADSDCRDPARATCFASLATLSYPRAALSTSNLHCLQIDCKAHQTDCPGGESCLPSVLPPESLPPDICVPHCDSNLNCPPNFFCARRTSGPPTPDVCIPGVPGLRCSSSLDCAIGECTDTGEGFKICSTPCQRHEDCAPFESSRGHLMCVPASPGGGHCVGASPFAGPTCKRDDQCGAGRRCAMVTPYERGQESGECRVPCDASGGCAPRGGIPHVCLDPDGERTCYPGRAGLPCRESSQCMAGLACLPGTDAGSPRTCTTRCAGDEDCSRYPWIRNEGYCQDGLCRLGKGPGEACLRDAQCRTGRCRPNDAGSGGVCVRS
jgi:hypothetical protein